VGGGGKRNKVKRMYERRAIGYDLGGWNDAWMVGLYMRRDSLVSCVALEEITWSTFQ
jgi:hypothetical protein